MIRQSNVALPGCRFTILGPPRLNCRDVQLDLGAPQQQAVLLALLANSGRFVTIGELIDGLWGDRAPATGEAVIRTYISRLRRMLSEHGLGSAIQSQSGGYLLDPLLFDLDATEFVQLVDSARRERAEGNLAVAAKRLEDALSLWSGMALAGVPGEAADRERARLERLKLTATQELLWLRLELGQHAEVVAEVPLLIELNRLDEPLYEIYLLALYRCGRRAEALDVYRTIYDLLGQELGVSPGPQLRAIHESILRADGDIDADDVTGKISGVERPEPSRDEPTEPEVAETVGTRLERQRDRQFVGREAHRAMFRSMLHGNRAGGFAVLFLHGHAGMGKSTLLRKFGDDASAAGRTVWRADGTRSDLEQLATELYGTDSPVLLVDSFEKLEDLEAWFRGEFLPRLPSTAVVVVAGRTGPSPAWLTDPSWSGSIVVRRLEPFSAAESAALLQARGVDPNLRKSIMDFAGGHPFALSLAAEVGRSMSDTGQPSRHDAVRYVVDNVVTRLVGSLPSATHRMALHVCAHARYTTEDLLRSVIQTDDAMALFCWLRQQPYVETAQYGLDINGVLREVLDCDLRWRDPVRYEEMHLRIRHYAMGKLLGQSDDAHSSVAAMRTIAHLRRRGRVFSRYVSKAGEENVELGGLAAADHEALIAMAHEKHGEFVAGTVRYWIGRQPEAFQVLRDRVTKRIRAYMSWLIITRPEPADLDSDPVVADIWYDLTRRMNLPDHAHFAICRHLICPGYEAKASPIIDMLQARLMRGWLHDPGLAASYLVLPNREYWRPLMEYLDQREVENLRADYPCAIFAHDWLADPPAEWQDHHLNEELWAERRLNLFVRER